MSLIKQKNSKILALAVSTMLSISALEIAPLAALANNENVLIQKIYQNIASYLTDDNSDELKHNPTFTTILGLEALAFNPQFHALITLKIYIEDIVLDIKKNLS